MFYITATFDVTVAFDVTVTVIAKLKRFEMVLPKLKEDKSCIFLFNSYGCFFLFFFKSMYFLFLVELHGEGSVTLRLQPPSTLHHLPTEVG